MTADGERVVSHAGTELLGEIAQFSGLTAAWDAALLGTYKALPIHFPGRVLADMAVAIAGRADSISDLAVPRDQPQLFGAVASTPTAWRVLDRVSEGHLALLRQGRAMARAKAWAAGAGPDLRRDGRHRAARPDRLLGRGWLAARRRAPSGVAGADSGLRLAACGLAPQARPGAADHAGAST